MLKLVVDNVTTTNKKEKLLRRMLKLPKETVNIVYTNDSRYLPGTNLGIFKSSEMTIYIRDTDTSVFTLAHEMYHAYQYVNIHRRKWWRGYTNFHYITERDYENKYRYFWSYRRYRNQVIERTADKFAFRFLVMTGQWDEVREAIKERRHVFFHYTLGLGLIKMAFGDVVDFFKKKLV